MKVVNLADKKKNDAMWPIDCILPQIDDYEEVLIIARKKNSDGYTRFSTTLKSTFWWAGCMEAVKRMLMDESITREYE